MKSERLYVCLYLWRFSNNRAVWITFRKSSRESSGNNGDRRIFSTPKWTVSTRSTFNRFFKSVEETGCAKEALLSDRAKCSTARPTLCVNVLTFSRCFSKTYEFETFDRSPRRRATSAIIDNFIRQTSRRRAISRTRTDGRTQLWPQR